MESEYDILAVMERLPHRYPFLLVDRVINLIPGEKILALKNVTMNEPFFQGHFPGRPVMPGVLIIEAMAQAGGILAYETAPAEKRNRLIYFMGMDKVRFRKMVIPGDQIIFEANILKFRTKVAKMSGTATVDGQLVAEAELMASFGDTK
ncbi:3-hydroxyacyl-[acyl-carrier-protein] dehydratase, FabZ form (EC [Olavius algarvensis Delta 1 endosymbiont]|nr:3-hydroxyacyl-[acyl-carrier-protein] dehydratase, FabZ form (EC [Olavius algarvensis Delta 1 endosymbiont]